jgi:hypothetical protein
MDKVQKPSDPECYTPSSEPFRFYISLIFSINIKIWKVTLHDISLLLMFSDISLHYVILQARTIKFLLDLNSAAPDDAGIAEITHKAKYS